MKILMVCLGNICRSPLAEGILRKKTREAGIDVEIDSAGFESCNVGDCPDYRTLENAKRNGLDISNLRARLFRTEDFDRFDKIYVMDYNNMRMVKRMARSIADMEKVNYILSVVYPNSSAPQFVADPYYMDIDAFQRVYDQLDEACEIICNKLKNNEEL
ncbi:MAG: low molecular weight phosphotyrosine protein phosphatase [Bacteroidales bacterium]|nr:low molecular weight phosphotyrosine protein phosphatase [Bacteroidales bacterium]